MESIESVLKAPWFPVLTGLVGYAGGFISDIGKEHFKLKLRRREEHAQEIQKEVLTPIYDYLKEFYLPICEMKFSPVEVGTEVINRKADHIAQDIYVRTEFRAAIKTPAKTDHMGLFQNDYWRENEGFQRYFEDALKHHYPDLLQRWRKFSESYLRMAKNVKARADSLIPKIQEILGLQLAFAGGGPEPPSWANYPHLAVLVLHRQLGIGEEGLYIPGGSNNEIKTSRTQTTVIKCGSAEQGAHIIETLDNLAKESAGIDVLKGEFGDLEKEAKRLQEDFRFALAKKPDLKKCPLV